jgi:hypothetical protein
MYIQYRQWQFRAASANLAIILSSAQLYSIFFFKFTNSLFHLVSPLFITSTNIANMSKALAGASVLKPEIRLTQAVSQFVADLSSEQEAAFHAHKSHFERSPPDQSDVMRLTAEINRASLVKGNRSSFGSRMTNFLYAVQQFAAIGDVLVGGSQNVFACGIVSKVNRN